MRMTKTALLAPPQIQVSVPALKQRIKNASNSRLESPIPLVAG